MPHDASLVRNFCIIAHVDHGKSTLADRLIARCGGLSQREMVDQVLDSLDVERERGITVKAQTVNLKYEAKDGLEYQINLIDTPGHIDFSHEVTRSIQACEGAVLLVDAAQGVEAQTIANTYVAAACDLTIIPVLNKVDLPHADTEGTLSQIEELIGLDADDALSVSAKDGSNIDALLEAVVTRIPAPTGQKEGPLRAQIIDSWFDSFSGVSILVRVRDGTLQKSDRLAALTRKTQTHVISLYQATPKRHDVPQLQAGDVGIVTVSSRDLRSILVGDTLTRLEDKDDVTPIKGVEEAHPMMWASLFCVAGDDFESFRNALEQLALNDAALEFQPVRSAALGNGFRCGFLGQLHMEIVQQRLENEHGLDLIVAAPSVPYLVHRSDGKVDLVDNPADLARFERVDAIEEPLAEVETVVPEANIGHIMTLCSERRGIQKEFTVAAGTARMRWIMPLSEVIWDLHDEVKSATRGLGSVDYKAAGFTEAPIVRLDILVNGDPIDQFAMMLHRSVAVKRGRQAIERLGEAIPRQLYEVILQAAIHGKILARFRIAPQRKNVTAKCYGGDITRKKKLLEKQKKGKKRMKQIGNVTIPKSAFLVAAKQGTR